MGAARDDFWYRLLSNNDLRRGSVLEIIDLLEHQKPLPVRCDVVRSSDDKRQRSSPEHTLTYPPEEQGNNTGCRHIFEDTLPDDARFGDEAAMRNKGERYACREKTVIAARGNPHPRVAERGEQCRNEENRT